MRRSSIACAAAVLALAGTPLWAMSGDQWHGSNLSGDFSGPGPRLDAPRAAAPSVITYEETVSTVPVYVEPIHAPVVVEREVYVARPVDVVVASPVYDGRSVYDPLHPNTGPWIDHGLFNRKGPNDFGS